MLKYLIILLDDISVPYCHYSNGKNSPRLIEYNDLTRAITFGMKENLRIQFVYPDYELPSEYEDLINNIDNVSIKPADRARNEDIAVGELQDFSINTQADNIVLRTTLDTLSKEAEKVIDLIFTKERVNLILTDITSLSDKDVESYRELLSHLVSAILQRNKNGAGMPQLNILTDRLTLTGMNNCNAGAESITIAPDGKFYICPAFYYGKESDCGSVLKGLNIKNPQLYKLDHAPLCRECDAWQCHRCVWMNYEKTLEVNTPGHIQCVISHLERNASRDLLAGLRKAGGYTIDTEIPEISYLDPFEKKKS